MHTILQGVPVWGHAIRKIESANHACICYQGALEMLVQDKTLGRAQDPRTNGTWLSKVTE